MLAWADADRKAIARALVPSRSPTAWSPLLSRLDRVARELHDLDSTAALASLAAERSRPVRVAIVGEFNAGKSTFINALIGADVAPTGVLPTTATLHHLRYATARSPASSSASRRATEGPPSSASCRSPSCARRSSRRSRGT